MQEEVFMGLGYIPERVLLRVRYWDIHIPERVLSSVRF